MRSRIIILSFLSILLLASLGCARRQKVATAPDTAPPPAVAETSPVPEPMPEAPAEPAPEPDPLSGDLATVNEYLRRQGLLEGTWCLNPAEVMSPGQDAEIDRVYAMYPHLNDDAFVAAHLDEWLRPVGSAARD